MLMKFRIAKVDEVITATQPSWILIGIVDLEATSSGFVSYGFVYKIA